MIEPAQTGADRLAAAWVASAAIGRHEPTVGREGALPDRLCDVCGKIALFGDGVFVRRGVEGRWFCREHRPGAEPIAKFAHLPPSRFARAAANAAEQLPANAPEPIVAELTANALSLELPANGKRGRPKRSAEGATASKAARAEYMRDLMRRRRAAKGASR